MSDRAIYSLITKHTCAAFGRAVNPHLFRDCTATSIAIDLPAYADITRQILGHATMETSRQHYNHAGTADASQRMQAVIAKLRRRPGI